MSAVLEFLEAFNRKERYFLIKEALGSFSLSTAYRTQLGHTLRITIPENAYVAMDYHLTWLYASLFLAGEGVTLSGAIKRVNDNESEIVRGNQEDIDLLVAFDEADVTHVIVIEAKGVTGWTNSQLKSKAKRLMEIFGEAGADRANVKPHFVLTSPKESQGIDSSEWPNWMRENDVVAWMPLTIPSNLLRVSRCDDKAKPSATGGCWTVLREGRSSPLAE